MLLRVGLWELGYGSAMGAGRRALAVFAMAANGGLLNLGLGVYGVREIFRV